MATMIKSKVALVKCDTDDCEQVIDAVETGVRLIGGISSFVKEGEKILMKPNVLIGTNPEKCVCTHPSVFRAVGVILKKAKVTVSYGDSSGFGKSEVNMKRAKLKQVADEMGITLADFTRGQHVAHNGALLNKRFFIANSVLESDGLVSLPKLKTHGLTRFTGAIKSNWTLPLPISWAKWKSCGGRVHVSAGTHQTS